MNHLRLDIMKLTLMLFTIAVFVGVGTIMIRSQAAAPAFSLQPESGVLASGAVSATDSTASGGKSVRFSSTTTDPFLDTLSAVPGLKHYYPLDSTNQARDLVGSNHGVIKGTGVTFSGTGASFTGTGYIELPDHNNFSIKTTGGLTILLDLTITNWKGAGGSEYIHWMGKGVSGAHEYTFRHYVAGGTGEASTRQGRVSFYHFNPSGGLGAGSYFQDSMNTSEHVITVTGNMKQVQMYKNGVLRDTDLLSGYSVVPQNTTTPVRIGTRDMSTGYLVGKIRRVAFYDRVLTTTEIQNISSVAKQ